MSLALISLFVWDGDALLLGSCLQAGIIRLGVVIFGLWPLWWNLHVGHGIPDVGAVDWVLDCAKRIHCVASSGEVLVFTLLWWWVVGFLCWSGSAVATAGGFGWWPGVCQAIFLLIFILSCPWLSGCMWQGVLFVVQ